MSAEEALRQLIVVLDEAIDEPNRGRWLPQAKHAVEEGRRHLQRLHQKRVEGRKK